MTWGLEESANDNSKKGFFQALFRAEKARRGETRRWSSRWCSIDDDGRAELPASAAPLFSPPAGVVGNRIRPTGQVEGWLTEVPQRVCLWCT